VGLYKSGETYFTFICIYFQPQVFTLTSLNGVRRRQDLGQAGVEDMIQLS
jgi:hypothetical protein